MGDARLDSSSLNFKTALKSSISERVFSFYLSNNNFTASDYDSSSEFIIGEVDTTHASGDLTYLPLYNSQGFWSLQLTALRCGSSLSLTVDRAILDTGASLLLAPAADAYSLIAALNTVGSCAVDASAGLIICDCQTHDMSDYPDIVFSLGGSEFPLLAEDYFWQIVSPI